MPSRDLATEFPDDYFPATLNEFLRAAARTISAPDEYLAGAMLAAASTAIGTSVRAFPKPGWQEPASLFVASVGYSASGKSPAYDIACGPLYEQQRVALEKAAAAANSPEVTAEARAVEIEVVTLEECGSCDTDDMECCADLDCLIEDAPCGTPIGNPRFPDKPLQHLVVKDTTLPALWECLAEQPRGVMVLADELGSMFLQATAAMRQDWCEIYGARSRSVHRKGRKRGPLILPRTFVTLAGGIQPDLFPTIRGRYDGGLLERFLLCGVPERGLPPWSDEVLDPDLENAWNLAVVSLLSLEDAAYSGSPDQHDLVRFSRAAYERLKTLYEDLQGRLVAEGIPLRFHGVVRKLVGNAVRLALIRRCLRWASGEFGFFGPLGLIDEHDCDAACRAAEFFLTRYLLWVRDWLPAPASTPAGGTPNPEQLADQILAYAVHKGFKSVEVRYLRQQGLKGNPSTDLIRAALDVAASRGLGSWADTTQKTFVLS